MKKVITIVSPCFNEEENIRELYRRIHSSISEIKNYDFEILFIDNASTDDTVIILKELIEYDSRIKVIVNNRNFGHIRSPYWGVLQSWGDATIYMASDLQDPPEYISHFVKEWELGWKVVMAVKPISHTHWMTKRLRSVYYQLLDAISQVPIVKDSTGFGLYDSVVLDHIRVINDPLPFFRGLVCELGYPIKTIKFEQPRRVKGISKNNYFTLYETALLGLVNHSLVPIRIASLLGIVFGVFSILAAAILLLAKLVYWDAFPIGYAPLGIALLLVFGTLLFFIGIVGEYVGAILGHVQNRPIVVEKERINF
jgi:glycosyltransferase involved in cell wall biosynthesis